jgi:hypothetical protein
MNGSHADRRWIGASDGDSLQRILGVRHRPVHRSDRSFALLPLLLPLPAAFRRSLHKPKSRLTDRRAKSENRGDRAPRRESAAILAPRNSINKI